MTTSGRAAVVSDRCAPRAAPVRAVLPRRRSRSPSPRAAAAARRRARRGGRRACETAVSTSSLAGRQHVADAADRLQHARVARIVSRACGAAATHARRSSDRTPRRRSRARSWSSCSRASTRPARSASTRSSANSCVVSASGAPSDRALHRGLRRRPERRARCVGARPDFAARATRLRADPCEQLARLENGLLT